MDLDNHKMIAFFGEEFTQLLLVVFKLSPTTTVKLLRHHDKHYRIEVVSPNPISLELEQVIQKLVTSAVLSDYIQKRLFVSGELTIWQTSDSPPSIMLTS
jgi:hypothetical protein